MLRALGSSRNQGLRWAIVRATAPTLTKGDLPSGETPYVKESGRGVDWVITDREIGRALAIVEHKPLGGPAHGTWAYHRLVFNTTAVICDAGYLQELNRPPERPRPPVQRRRGGRSAASHNTDVWACDLTTVGANSSAPPA